MLAESRDSVYGNASRRASAAAESGSDAGADAVSHYLQTLVETVEKELFARGPLLTSTAVLTAPSQAADHDQLTVFAFAG